MDHAMSQLRKNVQGEEFDYPYLMSYLQDYSKPRDKISRYLKNQDIIRVKKGLYVFGEEYRKGFVSLEVLANLIYGPSYISLEYALGYYGLILERVEQVTSMTTQKTKAFDTPLGGFAYYHLPDLIYEVGIIQQPIDEFRHCLIASPEKALADLLARQKKIKSLQDLETFLWEDIRLNESFLREVNKNRFKEIAKAYHHPSVDLLGELVRKK